MARLGFFLGLALLTVASMAAEPWTDPVAPEYQWRSGDNPAWADSKSDDGWETMSLKSFPYDRWQGVGWFRYWVDVPSERLGQPLALDLARFFGAVEIYIEGELFHQQGQPAVLAADEQPYVDLERPLLLIPPDSARSAGGFQLVMRYSSHLLTQPGWQGALPSCRPYINDYQRRLTSRARLVRKVRIHQHLIASVSAGFALVHLFFFFCYPQARGNADLALLTASLSVTSYASFQDQFVVDPEQYLFFKRLGGISFAYWALESLRFQYVLNFKILPRITKVFSALTFALAIHVWFFPLDSNKLLLWFMMACIVVGAISFRQGDESEQIEGLDIIGWGSIPIIFLGTHQLLVGLGFLEEHWTPVDFPGPYYAMLALMVSLSIVLARNFSGVNRDLKTRLAEVRDLSEANMKQELDRILLVSEYARKTEELEASRRLQLSMLPRSLPQPPGLDIAVHMDTAEDVGGDYYDFVEMPNGALAAAVGDATGHGLRAGTMVAAAKSLFRAHGGEPDPAVVLKTMSKALHGVGFRKMFMTLTLLHLRSDGFTITAAGMPAALLYRAGSDTVEEIEFKSPPLAAPVVFPYKCELRDTQPGDVVLVMSDGFLELFNSRRDMLGLPRTVEAFGEIARTGASAREVIGHLVTVGRQWRGGVDQGDDVTFMVGRFESTTVISDAGHEKSA